MDAGVLINTNISDPATAQAVLDQSGLIFNQYISSHDLFMSGNLVHRRRLHDAGQMNPGGPVTVVTYWVILEVNLHSTFTVHDPETNEEDGPFIGYVRTYGVSAGSEAEATALAASDVQDGEINWAESQVWVVVPERLDPEILARSEDRSKVGVWYRGGMMFYTPDDDEAAS